MAVQPLSDRILVERLEDQAEKIGSLYVPDTAKEKPQQAKVVEVGPGKQADNGDRIPMEVSKGDTILISKYGGTEIKVEGKEMLIIRQDDVLAVFK